eukprot:5566397-Pyramimonas_sp.AAC.1
MEHWELATRDLDGATAQLRSGMRRRAAPNWSVPAEVWGAQLPRRARYRRQEDRPQVTGPMLQEVPIAQLAGARQHGRLNARWNLPQTYQVSKRNHRPRTRRTRLLHGLCSFGNAWVGARGPREGLKIPAEDRGYVRGRSRVGASTVGNVLQWRLQKAGLSHIATKHDMTNAIASARHQRLDNTVKQLYRPE